MSDVKLRPHHALCMQFFEGRGYSKSFVDNMYSVFDRLKKDPYIEITEKADSLCRSCPNMRNNDCKDCEIISKQDKQVMLLCGFSYGDIINIEKFFYTAKEKIINCGKLHQVCGDCRWSEICYKKA